MELFVIILLLVLVVLISGIIIFAVIYQGKKSRLLALERNNKYLKLKEELIKRNFNIDFETNLYEATSHMLKPLCQNSNILIDKENKKVALINIEKNFVEIKNILNISRIECYLISNGKNVPIQVEENGQIGYKFFDNSEKKVKFNGVFLKICFKDEGIFECNLLENRVSYEDQDEFINVFNLLSDIVAYLRKELQIRDASRLVETINVENKDHKNIQDEKMLESLKDLESMKNNNEISEKLYISLKEKILKGEIYLD